jgi:inosine-uridine nucleoside N-ribohydrolase
MTLEKKIPVILDTDIGGDIDDTWALGFLLKCPEVDLKLVTTSLGIPEFGAQIVAKFLEVAGRTDIPIGIGLDTAAWFNTSHGNIPPQGKWVKDYDLKTYPGEVYEDGVSKLIDTILNSDEKVTVLAIGPAHNIGEALAREPRIAENARFVGMHGSIYMGYGLNTQPCGEWNVVGHPYSLDRVFNAPWEVTITPLDTCSLIVLSGELFQKVYKSDDPIAKAVIENYTAWLGDNTSAITVEGKSSTLFDVVAAYLTFSEEHLNIEELGLSVTHNGFTKVDANRTKKIRCAITWKDMDAFNEFWVKRLTE